METSLRDREKKIKILQKEKKKAGKKEKKVDDGRTGEDDQNLKLVLEAVVLQVKPPSLGSNNGNISFHFISFILVVKPRTLRKANLITVLVKNPTERRQGRKFQF